MGKPLLVVVQGPPAAGKTTVAQALAARLRLPLIAKDTIKEALFDALGTGDLEWSRRLGEATYLAMLALVEESVELGASLVVEGNFVRGSEFEARLAVLPARFAQVHCSAPLALLEQRYADRERHPGHVDAQRIDALREAVMSGRHDPLDLSGETIRIDSSGPVHVAALAERLELDPELRRRIEERAEQLLAEDPKERSARTQRLLAERIAYHEVMAEREAGAGRED